MNTGSLNALAVRGRSGGSPSAATAHCGLLRYGLCRRCPCASSPPIRAGERNRVGPATSHALRQRPRSIDEVVDTAKQLAEQNQNRLVVEAEANLGAVSDTQAHAAVAPMDPFALMTSAKQLPTEHFADYAFVF